MPFRRILCAVDFSPHSMEAFRVGVEMARRCSATLHLFHVVEARPYGEEMIAIIQTANEAMERLVAQTSLDGSALSSEVTAGRASDEIVERARAWSADLIVIGVKGTNSIEDIIVGGTAETVIKGAPCSVLTVKLSHADRKRLARKP